MALLNDAPRIVQTIAGLSIAKNVTRGWPASFAKLPTVAVTEAGNVHAEYRDNRAYVDELIYDIRVFAYTPEDIDTVAAAVEDAMEGIGYTRILVHDDDSAEVRMKVMRYNRYA